MTATFLIIMIFILMYNKKFTSQCKGGFSRKISSNSATLQLGFLMDMMLMVNHGSGQKKLIIFSRNSLRSHGVTNMTLGINIHTCVMGVD